jgi:hypothetical protein
MSVSKMTFRGSLLPLHGKESAQSNAEITQWSSHLDPAPLRRVIFLVIYNAFTGRRQK